MEKNNKPAISQNSFTLFDVLIIILVVLLFASIAFRVGNFSISKSNDELSDYRISFKISDISADSPKHLNVADVLTIAQSGEKLGRIETIDALLPAKAYVTDRDGKIIEVQYPQNTRVDVEGTVISQGIIDNKSFLLGGKTCVTAGDSFLVKSERMDFVITVIDIVKK